ncbi:energy-coupling factor transporter transmembrane component T family protein [[Mycoplasma] gypis]|uniref:Energy-coupling factor transporter transmembrane component T n=1 Tax=[Mycoplasma] gypis TaxID=92404 RepID=A0ABZ2RQ98_9BACT|nr:energy-coupling factor transporter transmembrane component T [[Mycoplasma] gypis]MBN0919472.1 energy-coupling factor transporter transmembrane protein EcfT [[Mycoplasma] gypis]
MNAIIGKYVNLDTIIHKMDPRLKFIANILFIVLFFVIDHFVTLGILIFVIAIIYLLATRSFRSLIKKIRLPIYIGIFLFLVNIFTIKGATDNFIPLNGEKNIDAFVIHRDLTIINTTYWAPFGPAGVVQITYFSVMRATSITVRIYGVILSTTILTFTTKPVLLTKAINDLLYPLKFLKFPSEIITMIINIALRFIPTLLDEATRIMKAQSSRGVDFKNGKGSDKVKAFVTLIVPLFVSSFAKANDLSDAMTVRGYDPYAKRTHYRILKPKFSDMLGVLLMMGLTAMVILFQVESFQLPLWWLNSFIKV